VRAHRSETEEQKSTLAKGAGWGRTYSRTGHGPPRTPEASEATGGVEGRWGAGTVKSLGWWLTHTGLICIWKKQVEEGQGGEEGGERQSSQEVTTVSSGVG
jgi:hypothetical protein